MYGMNGDTGERQLSKSETNRDKFERAKVEGSFVFAQVEVLDCLRFELRFIHVFEYTYINLSTYLNILKGV